MLLTLQHTCSALLVVTNVGRVRERAVCGIEQTLAEVGVTIRAAYHGSLTEVACVTVCLFLAHTLGHQIAIAVRHVHTFVATVICTRLVDAWGSCKRIMTSFEPSDLHHVHCVLEILWACMGNLRTEVQWSKTMLNLIYLNLATEL